MIYDDPPTGDPIDQGDLIGDCPVVMMTDFDPADPNRAGTKVNFHRVVVLTQTCDLANDKTAFGNVAVTFDAQSLVDQNIIKPADIRGAMRQGRMGSDVGVVFPARRRRPRLTRDGRGSPPTAHRPA